jgi:nicotinate phosphoribosyltransferase
MKQDIDHFAIFTDLYELTMAAAFYQHKMFSPATFSLFIRDYPPNRGYFVSAGLEDVLAFLEDYHFSQEDLDYLSSTGLFTNDFLQFLGGLRFTGEVRAVPEGRLFFKDEPIVEVTAPIIEAQLVETFIINAVNLQVSIATKASRCVYAAQGRNLVDFSMRRTQGTDAGLKVARASYIAGFAGTSNVLAGQRYGLPVSGTMAHSFITAFEEEIDSFHAFAETFPENTVLLIDTYDTVAGARKAVEVARDMGKKGQRVRGVRLDSGDMAELSKEVRTILQQEGLDDLSIFASGGFDEYKIADVLERGAEIDAFGIGTKMGVSADAPYTDMAYKLVRYGGRPVLKLSTGKKTLVGEKQVFRTRSDTSLVEDTIALLDEKLNGEPLLKVVMRNGNREQPPEGLREIQGRFKEEFAALADAHKAIKNPEEFPVKLAPGLKILQKEVTYAAMEKELGES